MWCQDPTVWAETVFGRADLGDARLERRLVEYAGRQAADPTASTHKVCGGDAAKKEATFRFLRNDRVEPESIAESGFLSTVDFCKGRPCVVVAEDSTTMNFRHGVADELGEVGGIKGRETRGYCIHSALGVDYETGEILGLLDQDRWIREEDRGRKKDRKKRKYEDKEAIKWQRSSERVRSRVPCTCTLIWVCDREADIHEYLHDKLSHNEHFVVRAVQNRSVSAPEGHLWAYMEAQPVKGERLITVEQRGCRRGSEPRSPRPTRRVVLEVRTGTVTLTPKGPKRTERLPIEVSAVFLREKDPIDPDDTLEWMLLTNLPVRTLEEAEKVVRCYETRWTIEEFHKAWKSGCKSEERRLQAADNLERLLVILAFIAVRILQLRTALLAGSEQPCDSVLPSPYWQCLHAAVDPKKSLPGTPPTAAWAARALAKLAGWIDTKRTGRVGWSTLWSGWARLEILAEGWMMALAAMEKRE